MSHVWTGADPTGFDDPGEDYELGTRMVAAVDIQITGIRVWAPATSAVTGTRRGYLRTVGDSILATAVMPDQLPSGWSEYDFDAPEVIAAGATFWVTYGTIQHYGAKVTALPVTSADSAVTANLGGFSTTRGNLPSITSSAFYGVDIVYEAFVSTAPVVGISATRAGLIASATLTIEDDTPSGVGYVIEWGDGATEAVSGLGPHDHTYDAPGLYVILATATDGDGLTDSAATSVLILEPGDVDIETIQQGLANAADTIQGLRCFPALPGAIHPPTFAPVEYEHEFHGTFGGGAGLTTFDFTCGLYCPDTEQGRKIMNAFLGPRGDLSIRAALEADRTLGGRVKQLLVRRVRGAYRLYEVGDTSCLGAMIDVRIWA